MKTIKWLAFAWLKTFAICAVIGLAGGAYVLLPGNEFALLVVGVIFVLGIIAFAIEDTTV